MIKFIRALLFYSIQAGAGKHQFMHLKNAKSTRISFFVLLAFVIAIRRISLENAIQTSVLIPSVVYMAAIAIAYGMNWESQRKNALLASMAGTAIFGMVLQYTAQTIAPDMAQIPMLLTFLELAWFNRSATANQAIFKRLPQDVRCDGYVPGRF